MSAAAIAHPSAPRRVVVKTIKLVKQTALSLVASPSRVCPRLRVVRPSLVVAFLGQAPATWSSAGSKGYTGD